MAHTMAHTHLRQKFLAMANAHFHVLGRMMGCMMGLLRHFA